MLVVYVSKEFGEYAVEKVIQLLKIEFLYYNPIPKQEYVIKTWYIKAVKLEYFTWKEVR